MNINDLKELPSNLLIFTKEVIHLGKKLALKSCPRCLFCNARFWVASLDHPNLFMSNHCCNYKTVVHTNEDGEIYAYKIDYSKSQPETGGRDLWHLDMMRDRRQYTEYLKNITAPFVETINFPKFIPYPKSRNEFFYLIAKYKKLRAFQ